ncbi:MAG: MMPL family transporter, partial [Treponema sp.]|nr:MMPL family transporter [Treponema sp.]
VRSFFILSADPDFSRAREGAEGLFLNLTGLDLFEELSLYAGDYGETLSYLQDYRYMLLDRGTAALLERGEAGTVAEEALAAAYGAFSFAGLGNLETDPFLLADRELRGFLELSLTLGNRLSPREGVLQAERDGIHYVALRGRLSPRGAAINKNGGVRKIYASAEALAEELGVSFVFSGVPFHSYESSARARREITVITAVTMVLLLILFFWIFRSPRPALIIVFAAGAAVCFALSSALLVFRSIHILTFVFGASLIGICVDYGVHFFIHRRSGGTGAEAGRRIFRGVSLSFASSFICFASLFFAPFPILKQFALFSAAGLLSSYVTAVCLLPALRGAGVPPGGIKSSGPRLPPRFSRFLKSPAAVRVKKITLPVLVLASIAVILVNRDGVLIKNEMKDLYTMSPALYKSERLAAELMNYGAYSSYYLVSGSSPQELLEHEEELLEKLGGENTFLAVSRFIPSIKTQEKNYRAASKLLPLAAGQLEALGFPPESAETFRADFRARGGRFLLPESPRAEVLAPVLSNLWLGRSGGTWYSCVLPLGAAPAPLHLDEWASFVNKGEGINGELDALTWTMFRLLAGAYAFIIIMVFVYQLLKVKIRGASRTQAAPGPGLRRGLIRAFRISAFPLFPALVSAAVFSILKLPLSFFPAVGFILVFGLGLDYMFYITENKSGETEKAVALSYCTTALSFGALLFSSFAPVHLFSLTVFSGLGAAFAGAMLLAER